ncbi:MAG: creatininase family protein [Bacteroidales bacterium]|nr:MAG: creatininase family protein [Bacteroidales bacterium]
MTNRPYLLSEVSWKTVKETDYEVVILPWGATEAHNYHLPYTTDNIHTEYVAAEAAKIAWSKGAKSIVLPNVPYGVNTGQLEIKLTINMSPSTQISVLNDIIDSVVRQGLKKVVIFNGHGGNEFKPIVRELQPEFKDIFICVINWYEVVDWSKYFDDTGDHASEMETSIMLNIAPELVAPLSEAGEGKTRKLKFSKKGFDFVWAPRDWEKISADTGSGNPAKATEEKGEKYLKESITKIADFLVDLAATSLDQLYV